MPSKAILELGPEFYDSVKPADFPKAIPRFLNREWATRVGLELDEAGWVKHFARFKPLEGSLPEPLALRYHGHQFRTYNKDLGDGRGFLFAQLKDDRGRLLDFGTKGSGQTPWSRRGDGRLTLKGAMREALATEMLESLGVNTSKTFSFFETGEALERNDEPSPTRAAVLTRLSHSHVRYGTFQRLAFFQKKEEIAKLVYYCCQHFFPGVLELEPSKRTAAFMKEVTIGAAKLCASWMMAGFVHGVLNSDNMNVTGESFDYGPYRFLPKYDPQFTAAYFDETGLYAYGNQPESVIWNLERLAECLLLISDEE
ncbi:MAG: YdiU family protein, partial [Bdellovibrionota bacterium]